MIAFWALIIFGIIWVVRTAPTPRERDGDRPIRILDERLARGEIDREDYEGRRRILESHR